MPQEARMTQPILCCTWSLTGRTWVGACLPRVFKNWTELPLPTWNCGPGVGGASSFSLEC